MIARLLRRRRHVRELHDHLAYLHAVAERWRHEATFWQAIASSLLHSQAAIDIANEAEAQVRPTMDRLDEVMARTDHYFHGEESDDAHR